MASEIKVDTISEKTSANGVTIDGVSLKDSKIATANSVDSDAYVDASIDNAHLADNAVDTAEIADNAVTLAKMAGLARGKLIYGDASGDPAALAVGAADEVLTHDGTDFDWAAAGGITAANFRPNAKAIIINGDMKINQRGTVTGITTNTYTLDRWLTEGDDCTLTVSKDTDVPTGEGFSNSLKMDVTTANGSVSAGDLQMISTRLEGQDVQLFKKGTASAETFTLAFWVKNSITGTFIAHLADDDNSRECSQTFTVSSADTWEKKVVNFPADTTGAFTNDNGRSLRIKIYLDAGSDWTSGSLQTSWGSGSATTRASGITTGWTTSDSNNFWITGVQLEVGTYSSSTIPPFQHESYADNLRRCQRYYTVWLGAGGTGSGSYNVCAEASGTTSVANINFFTPVPLRATPTINNPVMGYFDYNTTTAGTSGGTVTCRGAGEGGMSNVLFDTSGAANLTDATPVTCRAYADLTMDAEL